MSESLQDAEILNGTVAQPDGGMLVATFMLPDGEAFKGEFQDEEQMRKLALNWCETVRAHWDAKVARKLDPLPEEVEEEIIEAAPSKSGAQQMIIEQYEVAALSLVKMREERAALNKEIDAAEELVAELRPLVEKWGST